MHNENGAAAGRDDHQKRLGTRQMQLMTKRFCIFFMQRAEAIYKIRRSNIIVFLIVNILSNNKAAYFCRKLEEAEFDFPHTRLNI